VKVAYVAGPFRAQTPWEVECNVRRAEEVALELWRLGFAVICPHSNTRFFDRAAPDDVWLRGDMEILRRCDLVVTVLGWDTSAGACSEVAAFDPRQVYDWPEDRDWLRHVATPTTG
jgi:hypothetical protein